MAEGRTAFLGDAKEALNFFKRYSTIKKVKKIKDFPFKNGTSKKLPELS